MFPSCPFHQLSCSYLTHPRYPVKTESCSETKTRSSMLLWCLLTHHRTQDKTESCSAPWSRFSMSWMNPSHKLLSIWSTSPRSHTRTEFCNDARNDMLTFLFFLPHMLSPCMMSRCLVLNLSRGRPNVVVSRCSMMSRTITSHVRNRQRVLLRPVGIAPDRTRST